MDEISRNDLITHIDTFMSDLERLPAESYFPMALGRLFNELLKQTKLQLGSHALLNTVASVKEHPDPELNPGASNAVVGTILGILGQLRVSLETDAGQNGGPVFEPDAAASEFTS